MSGAYTAKAAADTSPVVPPGWNPAWPFPGVYPPGYVPELSLAMTGQSSMVPGEPVTDVNTTLTDQETYVTSEPSEPIVYTSTLKSDNSVVGLKFSGGESFSNSVSGPYISVGDDFWGSAPEFVFNVGPPNVGDFIVLKASSGPFSYDVENEIEIEIVAEFVYTAMITMQLTTAAWSAPPSDSWVITGLLACWDQSDVTSPYCQVYFERSQSISLYENSTSFTDAPAEFGTYTQDDDGDSWWKGLTAKETAKIEMLSMREGLLYDISHEFGSADTESDSATYDFTIQVYKDGDLISTDTVQVVRSQGAAGTGDTIFATINGETGEVTIINP